MQATTQMPSNGTALAPRTKRRRALFCNYQQVIEQMFCCRAPCYADQKGVCQWGASCKFLHTDVSEMPDHMAWCQSSGSSPVMDSDSDLLRTDAQKPPIKSPCPWFQVGTCKYGDSCHLSHSEMQNGSEELQPAASTPGGRGYKACLCTFYVTEGLECDFKEGCFDAHGFAELRRVKLTVPNTLTQCQFTYSDSHVHLDHVLWSRKYGNFWFHKFQKCKRPKCTYGPNCFWLHRDEIAIERTLTEEEFQNFAEELRTIPGNFGGCVHNSCEDTTVELALQLVEWGRKYFDGRIYASLGIHPSNFEQFTPEVERYILKAFERLGPHGIAWGECGLDYFRRREDIKVDPGIKQSMKENFARQARLAVIHKLTLVIHTRDAEPDTMDVLREVVPSDHHVHLHCFMGSVSMMAEFLQGWPNGYVGIAGCVTYENSGGLVDIVENLPLQRMLLETDGPYLTPDVFRGEEAHPGHIPWIAEAVATLKKVSIMEVLAISHENFLRAYCLQ